MAGMEKMRDLEKQAPTPEQKPQEDWRKKALYNLHKSEAAQERTSSSSDRALEQGAMAFTDRRLKLEAAQERTSSPSDRDLEQGAMALTDRRLKLEAAQERTSSLSDRDLEQGAMAFTDRRLKLRERRWLAHRNDGGDAAASTKHQIHWHRRQESKAKFRRNDAHPNLRKLGRRKGWSSDDINDFKNWHEGKADNEYWDHIQCQQDQYIQNNYHKDETEEQ
jgi:hypothetical protein